jgi:hypothetical protein
MWVRRAQQRNGGADIQGNVCATRRTPCTEYVGMALAPRGCSATRLLTAGRARARAARTVRDQGHWEALLARVFEEMTVIGSSA